MAYEFAPEEANVQALVLGAADPMFRAELSLLYAHRLYFIANMDRLARRCNTIFNLIKSNSILPERECPGLADWQAASCYRPITLRNVMRIHRALSAIAASGIAPAIDAISVGGQTFAIPTQHVVPSVYYVNGNLLRKTREALGLRRADVSRQAVGHPNTLALLEDGENGRGFRVTFATAQRIYNILETCERAKDIEPIENIFTYSYNVNSDSIALERIRGNIIQT